MPEQQPTGPAAHAAVADRLREVARLLRQADLLEPEAQQSLAVLAEELADTLGSSAVPSAEEAQLGELAGQLIEALHRDEAAPVEATRHRLQEAIVAAEARAPFAAGLAQRLLDALANIGI